MNNDMLKTTSSVVRNFIISIMLLACLNNKIAAQAKPSVTPVSEMDFWLTTASQTSLLKKQNTVLAFGQATNSNPNIEVDEKQQFQSIDGFG